LFDLGVHIKVK